MSERWAAIRLGDVCALLNGRAYKKLELLDAGKYPVLRVGNFFSNRNWYYSDLELDKNKYCDEGDLLYAWSASFGPKIWDGGKVIYHYHIWKTVLDENRIDKKFLYYWFEWDAKKIQLEQGAGTTMLHVTKGAMEQRPLFLSTLSEQKCIVSILDAAFEGIDKAIANAEKNLANARELFDNYLSTIFTKKGKGWINTTIGGLCDKVEYGTSSKSRPEGSIPVLRMGNIQNGKFNWDDLVYTDNTDEIEKYLLKNNDVLFNRTNSAKLVGKTAIYRGERPAIFAGYLIRLHRKEYLIDPEFLNYYLNSIPAREYGKIVMSRSINQANINGTKLKQYPISIPILEKQQDIVGNLRDLEIETQRLETIYQKKLKALAELKQSILQKAFAGELTSDMVTASSKAVKVETTSPEFTAKILAFTYHRHVSQQRAKTFGRVKAQKTLHLAESIGGVNLGRKPIKDAAGPNDFKHMLSAEKWAKKNHFFEFVKKGSGYEFKKLIEYDKMMTGLFAAIKSYRKELDRVVDLVLPMDTKETEVLATIHAAWNNLVLDGAEVTDEAIIREARENWHSDKMDIPVTKFQNAIRLIRDKGLVPDGSAKRVGGQENLF